MNDQNKPDGADFDRVQMSFGRCCLQPDFFDSFYETFLASDPRLPPMFAHTDMSKQKQLLRHGISHLIQYAKGGVLAQTKIKELTTSHDRDHWNISPQLYPLWVDSLLTCVAQADDRYDDQTAASWRRVLAQGIEAMKAGY